MKSKRVCEAERSSLDIISTLPQIILDTILCLLTTEEAARTSILSREWRYKWTTIPNLYFSLFDVSKRMTKVKQVQGNNMDMSCKPFNDLLQILLSHQGQIHEFDLSMQYLTEEIDLFGFDQILLHLSKNHQVKILTLYGPEWFSFGSASSAFFSVPMSIFSLHHLTDLDLCYFNLDHEPVFNGFGSLRSLSLDNIGISTETLLYLLSNCPSLKRLDLLVGDTHFGDRDCTVIDLFKCLPVIEHLTIWGEDLQMQWLVVDSVPQELPTSLLIHLKYFCFEQMCFVDSKELVFLLVLIKCSPNLEKIKLKIDWNYDCYEEYIIVWERYSDVWLEHLYELDIEYFSYTKPEMEFVKFILARSPNLKKVRMHNAVCKEEKLEHGVFEGYIVEWEKNPNVWLEQLNELEIEDFSYTKPEMEFVKFILARSPNVKKVSISSELYDHDGFEEYSTVWEENSVVWMKHLEELELGRFCNTKPSLSWLGHLS